jgi:hypothetical protein
MEFGQIIQRLDWLDEEHRKDKATIEILVQRASNLEGDLKAANKKIKELLAQISNLSTTPARIDQYDSALAKQRVDILKYIDDLDKKHQALQSEIDKRYQLQYESLTKSIANTHKIKEQVSSVKREIKACATEEARLGKVFTDWETHLQELEKSFDGLRHSQGALEENLRQDGKHLVDLQGEVSASRKRIDEYRNKTDLFTDNIRRIETRLNEILAGEAERRQSQLIFLETQARTQVERDRTWKEWEESLNTLQTQDERIERNLQEWEVAKLSFKRTQETSEDLIQKFERRINEITEMQRLAEDRFRQEWVTFKADDQKRWTSYTLTQDETHKDTHISLAKMEERLIAMEDAGQVLQDIFQQTKDANEQLFQGMLAQLHELLSAYERIMSSK